APILPAPRISTRCIRAPSKRGAFCPRRAPGASGHGGAGDVTRRSLTGGKSVLRSFDMRAPETTSWHSASWQTRPAQQQPVYSDPRALERVVAHIARLPPIVVSWEIDALRSRLAAAQRGEAFLLQGGDCAEVFADCESDTIAKKLKILLQMSLVLLHGLKKPIIRVGRMAGQYAKPRSADTETRNGVSLPSYRGDLVNRPEFTPEARTPSTSAASRSPSPSRSARPWTPRGCRAW